MLAYMDTQKEAFTSQESKLFFFICLHMYVVYQYNISLSFSYGQVYNPLDDYYLRVSGGTLVTNLSVIASKPYVNSYSIYIYLPILFSFFFFLSCDAVIEDDIVEKDHDDCYMSKIRVMEC